MAAYECIPKDLRPDPQFVRVMMNMAQDLAFFSIAWCILILAFRCAHAQPFVLQPPPSVEPLCLGDLFPVGVQRQIINHAFAPMRMQQSI